MADIPQAPRVPVEEVVPMFKEPKGQGYGAFTKEDLNSLSEAEMSPNITTDDEEPIVPTDTPDASKFDITPYIQVGDNSDADKSLRENLTAAFLEALLNN